MWLTKKSVHPTYAEIAKETGVGKTYVWRVVKDYILEKRANGEPNFNK